MKTLILKLGFVATGILASQTIAQPSDFTNRATDVIRICAPSENLRVKLEGTVGGFIAKRLAGAEAAGEGEVFQDGKLLERLIEASPDDAKEIYRMYLDCVKPTINKMLREKLSSYYPNYDEPTEAEMRSALEAKMMARGANRKGEAFTVGNPINGIQLNIQKFEKDSCRISTHGGGYECTYFIETGITAFSNEKTQAGQDHAESVNKFFAFFMGGSDGASSSEVVVRRFVQLDQGWAVSSD